MTRPSERRRRIQDLYRRKRERQGDSFESTLFAIAAALLVMGLIVLGMLVRS